LHKIKYNPNWVENRSRPNWVENRSRPNWDVFFFFFLSVYLLYLLFVDILKVIMAYSSMHLQIQIRVSQSNFPFNRICTCYQL